MVGEKPTVTRILPPSEWRARQIGNLKAVGEKNFEVGVLNPKKDPIAEGIKAEDRYALAIKQAIEEKRRARALAKTNMEEWARYTLELGKGRLVDGVVKREEKVKRFVEAWQPILAKHVEQLDKMSNITLQDRVNKVIKNIEGLVALKGRWY